MLCRRNLINRFDSVVTFQPLSKEALGMILEHLVLDLQTQLDECDMPRLQLGLTEDAEEFLFRAGTSSEYGARELRRTFDRYVRELLARDITAGKLQAGGGLRIAINEARNDLKFQIRTVKRAKAAEAAGARGQAVSQNTQAAPPPAQQPVSSYSQNIHAAFR
jgi:ATP-dependent Clp protease ATP-binding subunit ClpA